MVVCAEYIDRPAEGAVRVGPARLDHGLYVGPILRAIEVRLEHDQRGRAEDRDRGPIEWHSRDVSDASSWKTWVEKKTSTVTSPGQRGGSGASVPGRPRLLDLKRGRERATGYVGRRGCVERAVDRGDLLPSDPITPRTRLVLLPRSSNDRLPAVLEFLARLDAVSISYSLKSNRADALMVFVDVPGERWEVEFMRDGSIEIEKFKSDGTILDGRELAALFRDFSD